MILRTTRVTRRKNQRIAYANDAWFSYKFSKTDFRWSNLYEKLYGQETTLSILDLSSRKKAEFQNLKWKWYDKIRVSFWIIYTSIRPWVTRKNSQLSSTSTKLPQIFQKKTKNLLPLALVVISRQIHYSISGGCIFKSIFIKTAMRLTQIIRKFKHS